MRTVIFVMISIFCCVQQSVADENKDSEETRCARSISSMTAILGQLKKNPSIRNEQISAAIDGHTNDPALRIFIRTEIAPKIFTQDKKIAENMLGSDFMQTRCVRALSTYTGSYGK